MFISTAFGHTLLYRGDSMTINAAEKALLNWYKQNHSNLRKRLDSTKPLPDAPEGTLSDFSRELPHAVLERYNQTGRYQLFGFGFAVGNTREYSSWELEQAEAEVKKINAVLNTLDLNHDEDFNSHEIKILKYFLDKSTSIDNVLERLNSFKFVTLNQLVQTRIAQDIQEAGTSISAQEINKRYPEGDQQKDYLNALGCALYMLGIKTGDPDTMLASFYNQFEITPSTSSPYNYELLMALNILIINDLTRRGRWVRQEPVQFVILSLKRPCLT